MRQKPIALTAYCFISTESPKRPHNVFSARSLVVITLVAAFALVACARPLHVRAIPAIPEISHVISGAEILLTSSDGFRYIGSCVTGSSGMCTFDLQSEQSLLAIGRASGYLTSAFYGDSTDLQTLVIRFRRGGTLMGTVIDEQSRPVRFAAVVATRQANRTLLGTGGALDRSYETRANSRGEYRIYGLPPGTYLVDARPTGVSARSATYCGESRVSARAAVQIPFLPQPQSITADIVMSATGESGCGSIEGIVTGVAEGDTVLVTVVSSEFPPRAIASATAEKSGQFHFSAIAAGEYAIIAVAPTSGASGTVAIMNSQTLAARQRVIVSPGVATEIALPLAPPQTVTFALPSASETGRQCSHSYRIRLRSVEEWGGMHELSLQSFPDERSISFTALPVTYEVHDSGLHADCIVGAPSRITVTSAHDLTAQFSVLESAEVMFTPPSEGNAPAAPAKDFLLLLLPQEDDLVGVGLTAAMASDSGRIEIKGIVPGAYSIRLVPRILWDDPERSIFDADGSLLTVQPGSNNLTIQ